MQKKRIKIKIKSRHLNYVIYSHFYYRVEDEWDKYKRYLQKERKKKEYKKIQKR